MIPKKSMNIYPKNEINLKALLDFYFYENSLIAYDGIMEFLIKEHRALRLNQIEFMCIKISDAFDEVFKPNLNSGKIQLKNLFKYAIDALTEDEMNWIGSKSRNRITKAFKDFVYATEVDITYLERNN